jgi:hypothetical protein
VTASEHVGMAGRCRKTLLAARFWLGSWRYLASPSAILSTAVSSLRPFSIIPGNYLPLPIYLPLHSSILHHAKSLPPSPPCDISSICTPCRWDCWDYVSFFFSANASTPTEINIRKTDSHSSMPIGPSRPQRIFLTQPVADTSGLRLATPPLPISVPTIPC